MKTSKQFLGFSQTAIAVAVLAAFNTVQAQEADLAKPTSWIGAGAGHVSGSSADRAQWGIYNGMREHDAYLLLDLDYTMRSDAGLWTKLSGRNLGLDNRELSFGQNQQGDWKYGIDYSEITRHDFRTINTADSGVGTRTPTINFLATKGTGSDIDLKTERKGFTLSGEKWVVPALLFEASFKSEDKDGARQWGRGYDCASYVCGAASNGAALTAPTYVKNAILMVAEPINSNIKQWEAKLTFHDEKLAATAGYYGSFYTNSNGNLSPVVPNQLGNNLGNLGTLYPALSPASITAASGGTMSLQQVLSSAMALPPDNQSHQIYVSGNYGFTPTAKATFKYAYTHATQHDSFAAQGLTGAPAGVSDLGGVVDSTLVQIGFTAKPIDKLSVLANWRYENKEDKTPNHLYNVEAQAIVPATVPVSYTNSNQANNIVATWNNNHQSTTKVAGKLEASYQFPARLKGTVGLDYTSTEREVPTDLTEEKVAGLGTLRAKNSETGYRLELKSNTWETFSGAIGYAHSKRGGSDWTSLSTIDATVAGTTANNIALSNLYCGGRLCYGQALPASSIIAMAPTANFPMNMTDLQRDKWKLSANWTPSEQLSLQFMLEDGKDKNTAPINGAAQALSPTTLLRGWQDTDNKFFSVDASYVMSENWRLSAYASHGQQTLDINHSTYLANMKTTTDAYGLGISGKATAKLQLGANLGYFNDVTATKYGIAAAASISSVVGSTITYTAPAAITATNIAQAAIGTPDVSVKKTTLALFGNYALASNSSVRLDLVHQKATANDWIWGTPGNPFYYADNTTIRQQVDQKVTFVGAKYIYTWQ